MYLHTRLLFGIGTVTLAALVISLLGPLESIRSDVARETDASMQLAQLLLDVQHAVGSARSSAEARFAATGEIVTAVLYTTPHRPTYVRLVPMGVGYRYAGRNIWLDGPHSAAASRLYKTLHWRKTPDIGKPHVRFGGNATTNHRSSRCLTIRTRPPRRPAHNRNAVGAAERPGSSFSSSPPADGFFSPSRALLTW